ncbi:hypothetical protein H7142_00010 [Candidatus Saccharibacteria bacterium]|nr:hypothetical protein [Candidatus Saccharibacteria bacterium]
MPHRSGKEPLQMSEVHNRPEVPNTMPFTEADKALAREKQQKAADRKRKKRQKLIAGVAGSAVLLGGGAAVKFLTSGNVGPSGSENVAELVLGSDGEPLQYVEYSDEHMDRDNNGSDDHGWDNNGNSIDDSEELWDQEKQEFVDPQAGTNETALEQASLADREAMSELENLWPTIEESEPHWIARFVTLDQRVKDYILTVARNPQDFEDEMLWRGAILSGFDYTAEELEESSS